MASLQTEQQGQIKDDLAVSSSMQSCPPGGSKPKRTAKKGKKQFLPLPSLDTAQHKLPWQLNFSQKLGRHAIACQNIHTGQCILAEKAVQAVPAQGHASSCCHTCLRSLPDDLHLSEGTLPDKASKGYKRYCSPACLHADCTASSTATAHAKIPQIAAETNCDPTLMHFILELDAQRQHQPCNIVSSPDSTQQTSKAGSEAIDAVRQDPLEVITCTLADVEALLSPFDQNQKGWRDAITAGCSALHQAIEQAGTYKPGTRQQLQSLAACINANAHATGHQADTNSATGLGMYPVLSMFNHSCNPNLAHSSIGTVQYVYAVRDIKMGEQLCVHYTSLYEPRKVRQQALLREKFFTCACERCSTPIEQSVDRFLEGISCGKGQCGEVMLKHTQADNQADVFKCVGCGNTVAGSNVAGSGPLDMQKQANGLYNHAFNVLLQQGSAAARPVFEQVLQSCQGHGKLNPWHARIFDCQMPAANGCRRAGDNIGAINHVTAMISTMEFYYPYPCIEVTNLYRFLAELYIDWACNAPSSKLASRPKRQAKETFRKFVTLQSICQGIRFADESADDLIMRLKVL
ncbi:hypothetical protein ABBQ38_007447 [Trebouxia sp. C0009 RCD-2024]